MDTNASPSHPNETPEPVDAVIAFLSRFVTLDETDRKLVRQLIRIHRYPKGAILLAQGDVAREAWLVIEGCVREFRKSHDDDQTLDFYTELQVVIPPTHGADDPSPVAFECLEEVVASVSTRDEEIQGLALHPRFEVVCRVMGEALMASLRQNRIDLVTRSPEQRYSDLVARRPDLLQRVPQYHIASFLGIQPETLSRIRRRRIRTRAIGC